jgi:hypothetical protein
MSKEKKYQKLVETRVVTFDPNDTLYIKRDEKPHALLKELRKRTGFEKIYGRPEIKIKPNLIEITVNGYRCIFERKWSKSIKIMRRMDKLQKKKAYHLYEIAFQDKGLNTGELPY